LKLDRFKLLTDENIHHAVVQFLRDRGFDVLDVAEEGLFGTADVELLRQAVSQDRVVVTLDATRKTRKTDDPGTARVTPAQPAQSLSAPSYGRSHDRVRFRFRFEVIEP